MNEYLGPTYQMKCASAEAEANIYNMKRVGKTVWLWRDGSDAGANIYCGSDDPNTKSEGFGGRALTFQLKEGGSIVLYGPWHTNSDALLKATGVDLTKSHMTFVVIGLGRRIDDNNGSCWRQVITNVIYQDEDWTKGSFNRGKEIATELADKRQEVLILYSQSNGGSLCGPVYPSNWNKEQQREYWKQKNAASKNNR